MQSTATLNRRDFIRTSGGTAAAVVAGTLATPAILRGTTPTTEPVRLGHIGIGVRGIQLLTAAASNPG